MKTAVVTGAVQGIGRAVCEALLKENYKVGMIDLAKDDQCIAELGAKFGQENVLLMQCDVTNSNKFEDTIEKLHNALGGIDVFVNNAGILNEVAWRKMVDVNLIATIVGVQKARELMSKECGGNGGMIINIGSMAGVEATGREAIYSVSKAGVISLSLTYGHEMNCKPSGVMVNCVCPGLVKTSLSKDHSTPNSERKSYFLEPKVIAEGLMTLLHKPRSGVVLVIDTRCKPEPFEIQDTLNHIVSTR